MVRQTIVFLVLACVIATARLGPEDIEIKAGTVWSLPKEFGGPRTVRLFGMQESSQLAIRCKAKLASEKYVEMRRGLDLDLTSVKTDGPTEAVIVSIITFTGDLGFREQNTYLYDSLLRAGLAKINPKDRTYLDKWVAKEFALAQEEAQVKKLGMWRKQNALPLPYDKLNLSFQAELVSVNSSGILKLDLGVVAKSSRYVRARLYGIQPIKKNHLKMVESYLRKPEGSESIRQINLFFEVRAVDADGTLAVIVRYHSSYGMGDAHQDHELNATSGIVSQGFGLLNAKEIADLPPKLQAVLRHSEQFSGKRKRGT